MKRLWAFALGSLLLVSMSCDLGRQVEARLRVQDRIQEVYGLSASVSPYERGGTLTVRVEFERMPQGDSNVIQARVETLVRQEYPNASTVVVSSKF